MTDDNNSPDIFSTPKLNNTGDGDGIKNVTVRKRNPVPSSRKFNVRTPCDEIMKLKLEQALTDIQKNKHHNCLMKAQSVAEITPTKTKPKKKPLIKLNLESDSEHHDTVPLTVTLHATPRPLDGTTSSSQASRRCTRDWAACKVYGRLLLGVWRRYKARLQTLSESNGRQLNQINQLELQVDFLKNMRQSECEKRNEALQECQQMKKKIEMLELAKQNLLQEITNVQEELMNARKSLKLTKFDLKKSTDQLNKTQEQLMKRKEEKMDLISKLATQEQEIYNKNTKISHLEEIIKTTEMNMYNIESNFKTKQEEFNDIQEQLDAEVKLNASLTDTIANLQEAKLALEDRSKNLENELEMYISNVEDLKDENSIIKEDLKEVTLELSAEKKKKWIKITKELSLLSLSALQKIVEIALPVYHKY